jgi:S-adenosylmethionine synthetase
VAEPTSISVNTFGTGKLDEQRLVAIIRDVFDLRPKGLIAQLGLLKPIYQPTAAYGHFGRTEDSFSWEKIDQVDALKSAAGV